MAVRALIKINLNSARVLKSSSLINLLFDNLPTELNVKPLFSIQSLFSRSYLTTFSINLKKSNFLDLDERNFSEGRNRIEFFISIRRNHSNKDDEIFGKFVEKLQKRIPQIKTNSEKTKENDITAVPSSLKGDNVGVECNGFSQKASKSPSPTSYLLVYYDLELTYGSLASEIYQVGGSTSKSEFSVFIIPKGAIHWGVTKRCGGVRINIDKNGQRSLAKNSKSLKAVNDSNGLQAFLEWIKKTKEAGRFDKTILIAHGDLDMPALLNNMARAKLLHQFEDSVDYFADSLLYLQTHFPDWKNYSISFLCRKILKKENPNPHDALEDAKALHDIMEELNKENREKFIRDILKLSVSVNKGLKDSNERLIKTLEKSYRNARTDTSVVMFNDVRRNILP